MLVRLIAWLTVKLIDCSYAWLIDWLIDWSTDEDPQLQSHIQHDRFSKSPISVPLQVNNKASKGLFKIYFHMMEPRCIRLKKVTKKKCVKRKWFRCKKYKFYKVKKAYYVGLHEALGMED